MNAAVIRGANILEVDEAFNFAASNERCARQFVEAWTLKVEKLRNDGGSLIAPGREQALALPSNVEILAVVAAPEITKQRSNFEIFQGYCKELAISIHNECIWKHTLAILKHDWRVSEIVFAN